MLTPSSAKKFRINIFGRIGSNWFEFKNTFFGLKICKTAFLIFFCAKIFLHEAVFTYFGGKISRDAFLNFSFKKWSGEPLCKFFQIFPPKVLVYRGNIFSSHLFN